MLFYTTVGYLQQFLTNFCLAAYWISERGSKLRQPLCLYLYMDGWMNSWMHGCMDRRMDGCMYAYIDGWVDVYM